jgi:hypothetical protein
MQPHLSPTLEGAGGSNISAEGRFFKLTGRGARYDWDETGVDEGEGNCGRSQPSSLHK